MSDLSAADELVRDAGPASHEQTRAVGYPLRPIRVETAGKFLRAGDVKFWVKGVTYGTFRGENEAGGYPPPAVVEKDFRRLIVRDPNRLRRLATQQAVGLTIRIAPKASR